MQTSKKTLNNLSKQNILPQVQYLWIHINEEEKDLDGFCLFKKDDWAYRLKKSPRTITRHLRSLTNTRLIEKLYRSTGYKQGVHLFIRPLEPETNDCMTLFATLHKCELLDQVEPVIQLHFQDVYNRSGTIRFKQCSALLKGVSIKRCEWLLPGKHICFSASLKVSEQCKEILHVSNLRPSGEYYHA